MWKYIVAFLVFAALAIWMIAKLGGDVDMGGEKHELPAAPAVDANSAPKK
jgi:hypothetical protein